MQIHITENKKQADEFLLQVAGLNEEVTQFFVVNRMLTVVSLTGNSAYDCGESC